MLHSYRRKSKACPRDLSCGNPPKISSTYVPSWGGSQALSIANRTAADFANSATGAQNSRGLFVLPNGHARSM